MHSTKKKEHTSLDTDIPYFSTSCVLQGAIWRCEHKDQFPPNEPNLFGPTSNKATYSNLEHSAYIFGKLEWMF